MNNRREFIRNMALLTGSSAIWDQLPSSIQKALSIDPEKNSTWLDAEHIVFLMQENRSFDHCFGSLQGVRGFNDPRAITLPDKDPVWLQKNVNGDVHVPFRLDMHQSRATWMGGLPHSWTDQVDARNNGKYDQWLTAKHYGSKEFKDLPMTLGYYTREDIPFYYAFADAFTVCDQHFCSSLTGTTPNRLYFWTGKLREDAESKARVRNSDTDYEVNAHWTTFPERLEEHGISWRVYQNELSVGVGFTGEEDAWLANFTDNPLEWFSDYHVKLSAGYIEYLQKAPAILSKELLLLEEQLKIEKGKKEDDIKKQITRRQKLLQKLLEEQKAYTKEKYEQLPVFKKSIHDKAFTTNKQDPFFHELMSFLHKEGEDERTIKIPKGDVLDQFRKDVDAGKLPTVSWLVAPEKFSDHPSAPWFGAWYVSEVLDILTKNPEVWKKTIFILTYDENDGYFDHVPPFVAPHLPGTGKVSAGIDTATEFVSLAQEQQHHDTKDCRQGPVGLGYRVPLIIASPWSRGGWVNSQVFDHTSSLQFLEQFLQQKYKKEIQETNISEWRRYVCGDLTSVFRSYNGEKMNYPQKINRNEFVQKVHNAKFRHAPGGWAALTKEEVERVRKQDVSSRMPQQEKGTRPSCALPYMLEADGHLSEDRKNFAITFSAGDKSFGKKSAGSPFIVYAPGKYKLNDNTNNYELCSNWSYAVKSGDCLADEWSLKNFEKELYHLRVYGPNGFYREFMGSKNDPGILMQVHYEKMKNTLGKLTGNLLVSFQLTDQNKDYQIEIEDRYKNTVSTVVISQHNKLKSIVIDTKKSSQWYDISLRVNGDTSFSRKYAGRIETGRHSQTDPLMGR